MATTTFRTGVRAPLAWPLAWQVTSMQSDKPQSPLTWQVRESLSRGDGVGDGDRNVRKPRGGDPGRRSPACGWPGASEIVRSVRRGPARPRCLEPATGVVIADPLSSAAPGAGGGFPGLPTAEPFKDDLCIPARRELWAPHAMIASPSALSSRASWRPARSAPGGATLGAHAGPALPGLLQRVQAAHACSVALLLCGSMAVAL